MQSQRFRFRHERSCCYRIACPPLCTQTCSSFPRSYLFDFWVSKLPMKVWWSQIEWSSRPWLAVTPRNQSLLECCLQLLKGWPGLHLVGIWWSSRDLIFENKNFLSMSRSDFPVTSPSRYYGPILCVADTQHHTSCRAGCKCSCCTPLVYFQTSV